MLSLSNVGNGTVAASYYEAADDYYTGDRSPSAWWGRGAADLGLSGPVDAQCFAALLDGKLPSGEALQHGAHGRRGGTDATFSAPKSVSLQAMIGGDVRLLDAHQRAVERALAYAETLAACRVTEERNTRTERAGNLLVACFEHDLSRACDPQVHTHCVILNMTRRGDGQWRALNNEALYRHKMLLGALYRAELAREVQALGYAVRVTHLDGRFELGHIDDHQIRAFSQRSAAIEAYLQDEGTERSAASAWVKKLAAVATREKKTAVDRELLRHEWNELSREQRVDYRCPDLAVQPVERDAVHAVVVDAVAHLGEREAVFTEAELLRAALERGVGIATLDELKAAIDECQRTGVLLSAGDRYTTPSAQQREQEILAFEVQGRDTLTALYTGETAELRERLTGLNEGQQAAAKSILLSHHQVIGIQGRAGVGKTTLLRAAAAEVIRCGYQVRGLAPGASAARELASTGITAETIAAFERRTSKGLDAKTVLVIDEAGMVSSNQMHQILSAAAAARCRVVLVGDTAQLAAVEAGQPFAQLQKNGMATTLVSQIQRQKNLQLKQAVEWAVDGQVALAVELLDKDIVQIAAAAERFERIAADYCALTPEEREHTRVVAGTRLARAAINARIRDRLGRGDHGETFTLLTRKDLTDAQRRSTLAYQVGDLLQADVDYPSLGLQRGERARVVAHLNHRVLLERDDGARVAWQPATAARLSAFTPETRKLGVGDLVRITANDHAIGLINGDVATVTAIDADRRGLMLRLANGNAARLDGSRPIAVDYGYCSTVYAAQGQTCDRVFVDVDAHSLTSNRAAFYVAISRAKLEACIYTDDRELLPLSMGRELEKTSALDLTPCEVCHGGLQCDI